MTALDFQDRMNPLTCMLIVCTRSAPHIHLLSVTPADLLTVSMAADYLTHLFIAFHSTIYLTDSCFFSARKYVLKHWCGIS